MVRPLVGASPSGKAPDFDSGIPRFESWRPSQLPSQVVPNSQSNQEKSIT